MLALALLSLGCPPSAPTGLVLTDVRTTTSEDQLNVRIHDYGSDGAAAPLASANVHVSLLSGLIAQDHLAEPAGAGAGGLGLLTGQDRYDFVLMAGTASVTDRLQAQGKRTTTFALPDRYTGGGAAAVVRPVFFVSPSFGVAYVLYQRATAGTAVHVSYAVAPLTGGTVVAVTPEEPDPQLNDIDLAQASPALYDGVQIIKLRTVDASCAGTLGLYYDRFGLYVRQTDLGTERVDSRTQGVVAYSVRAGLGGCASCGAEILSTDLVSGAATVLVGLTTAQLKQQVYPIAVTGITAESGGRPALEVAASVVAFFACLAVFALLIVATVLSVRVRFRRAKTTSAIRELVVPGRASVYHPESERPVNVDKVVVQLRQFSECNLGSVPQLLQGDPQLYQTNPRALVRPEHLGTPRRGNNTPNSAGTIHPRSSQCKLLADGSSSRYSLASGESSPAAERAARWSAAFTDGRPGLSRLRPNADGATFRRFSASSPEARRTRLDSTESMGSQVGDEDDPKLPLSPERKSDEVV
jgi:hypothetical protein